MARKLFVAFAIGCFTFASPMAVLAETLPASYPEAQTNTTVTEPSLTQDNSGTKLREDAKKNLIVDEKRESVKEMLKSKLSYDHVEGAYVVKYNNGIDEATIENNSKAQGIPVEAIKRTLLKFGDKTYQLMNIKQGEDLLEKMTDMQLNSFVDRVDVVVKAKSEWTAPAGGKTYPSDFSPTTNTNYWNLEKINMPTVWNSQSCSTGATTCGGSNNVTIAIVDDGLSYENYTAKYDSFIIDPAQNYAYVPVHKDITFSQGPEFSNMSLWTNPGETNATIGDHDNNNYCNDLHGVDFGQYTANLYTGESAYWTPTCDASADPYVNGSLVKEGHPDADSGHGDFIAGIIAANINNTANTAIGMAHQVSIMPLKASLPFDQSSIDIFAAANAIAYAADPKGDNSGTYNADIINLSFGSGYDEPYLHDAIDYAISKGVIIVAASGNTGGSVQYPAAYPGVIAVGASNPNNSKTSYTSFGPELAILAPVGEGNTAGSAIYSYSLSCFFASNCTSASNFATFSTSYAVGTSFAAPQVAATAALMLSNNPSLSTNNIRNMIVGTAGSSKVLNAYESYDDSKWTSWYQPGNGGDTPGDVSQVVYNSRIYQTLRGNSTAIYVRSFNGTTWTSWAPTGNGGESPGDINSIVFNSKLYQSLRGNSGGIYVRSFDGTTWTNWTQTGNGGITPGNVSSVVFNSKLYQTIRDNNSHILVRSFDGTTWTNWAPTGNGGDTPGDIDSIVYNSKLYQSLRGNSTAMFVRSFDGTTWSNWIQTGNGGDTPGNIRSIVFNSKLYQTVRGNSTAIYVRSFDGTTWGNWVPTGNGGETPGDVDQVVYNNKLYQSLRGNSTAMFVRSFDGTNWTNWVQVGTGGDTPGAMPSIVFNSRIYQTVRGNSTAIYVREYQ